MSHGQIRLTLHPAQEGAKQRRERYGEQLVCVRDRDDEPTKERWKTVELISEKRAGEASKPQWGETALVSLHVAAQEREIRQRVKAAGGKGHPKEVVWELAYGQAVALGLTERSVTRPDGAKRPSASTNG